MRRSHLLHMLGWLLLILVTFWYGPNLIYPKTGTNSDGADLLMRVIGIQVTITALLGYKWPVGWSAWRSSVERRSLILATFGVLPTIWLMKADDVLKVAVLWVLLLGFSVLGTTFGSITRLPATNQTG